MAQDSIKSPRWHDALKGKKGGPVLWG